MASKLLVGFALGFAAGVLLAPDKGSETRKKITQKGKELKNKFNDFVDTLNEKFDAVQDEVEETADQAVRSTYGTSTGLSGGTAWG